MPLTHWKELRLPIMMCGKQGDLYVDKNMYLKTQPERYKGFLSSDFSKTDEFSNVCRTEQYRSQLKVQLSIPPTPLRVSPSEGNKPQGSPIRCLKSYVC